MPDADHSLDFWTDVATRFKDDGNVVFDLFNEPFPDNNQDTVTAWTCWRDGGAACPNIGYAAVGMQQLVDTVRATGAANLIVLGGVQYSRINSHWLTYEPNDRVHNLAASWHLYPNSYCSDQTCWDTQFQPFLSQTAAVATEIGQGGTAPCPTDFLDTVMLWLDAHEEGYLAWTWDAWGDCFSLIGNWGNASPLYVPTTPYGQTYHDHLLGLPQPPTGVVAGAGDATAAVAWSPPVDHGTSAIAMYTVTPHDQTSGRDGTPVAVSSTSASLGGLVDGDAYTFTVTATNDAGTSAPSSASGAVTPRANQPPPAAATGTASTSSATTVTTGSDPTATGGTATAVTVPAGTAGGSISVTQTGTSATSPSGYQFGSVQIAVTSPAATPTNPLRLVFTQTPPSGAPLDATTLGAAEVYRTEAGSASALIPDCTGSTGQASPDPCVASKQYVMVGGSTFIQVTVLTSTASLWNTARPAGASAKVTKTGYAPATVAGEPGVPVKWTFADGKPHSVTDLAGLGPARKPWFDSTLKSSGTYTFAFPAAGTFAYRSTGPGDKFTGTVGVPIVISQAGPTQPYVVTWAVARLSGYVFDVRYRFRPSATAKWGAWVNWQTRSAAPDAVFQSPKHGQYDFEGDLRNQSTGVTSGMSPDTYLTVP